MYIKTRAGGCGKIMDLYLHVNLIYWLFVIFRGFFFFDTIDNNFYFDQIIHV